MPIHSAFLLLVLALARAAAAETSATARTWQTGSGVGVSYLTIDDRRGCVQNGDGEGSMAFRLVRDDGRIACYRSGVATGAVLELGDSEVAVVDAAGRRQVFTPCSDPPEAVGWAPYELPAPDADPASRKAVAVELRRRFDTEQRLRREFMSATSNRLDAASMTNPQAKAAMERMSQADEDNRRWLEKTLRTSGWIGRKSHGDQAHEALVFIGLHTISHLRLGATIRANLAIELKRGDIGEMSFAGIADRFDLVTAEPMSYGIQGGSGADGKIQIAVIADTARLEANRKRLGLPSLAQSSQMMGTTVVRIADDGRLAIAAPDAKAAGLDGLDLSRATREPMWGLAEAGRLDAALGSALSALSAGDPAALQRWTSGAGQWHRTIVAQIALALPARAGADSEAATVAQRPLFDALLAGMPASDDRMRIELANTLSYGLVARTTAPTAEELARAATLADELDHALKRPEVERSPLGHAVADTIACVRYRQDQRPAAATLWRRAIALTEPKVPDLYRRRLTAAEADAPVDLPR
jgi:hypothetical protein